MIGPQSTSGTFPLHPGIQAVVSIFVVSKDNGQSRQGLAIDSVQESWCCRSIVGVGCGHHQDDEKSQCILQQMTLPAFEFLSTVGASLVAADLRRLHRLTINTSRTGRRFATFLLTNASPERSEKFVPGAVIPPLDKIVIHGTVWKQIMWQQFPLTTRAVEILDLVDHLSQTDFTATTTRTPAAILRNDRFNNRPLLVREICRISLTRLRFRHDALLCGQISQLFFIQQVTER